MTDQETLARQLSWLFLTSDWQRDLLIVTASRALGGRPRWLADVVDQMIGYWPVKPADRPRQLADWINSCEALETGLIDDRTDGSAGGRRWRVQHLPVIDLEPADRRAVVRVEPMPVIGTEDALADLLRVDLPLLLWLADTREFQRRTPRGPLHPYRYRWIDRGVRVPRLLEIPGPLLRHVQRRVLHRILDAVPTHPAAYGFVRGRDARANAEVHVGSDWLISCDLRNFFGSVRAGRCYATLRRCGINESVGWLLTGLITQRTPAWVIGAMPSSGSPVERDGLRAALRTPHLPQGSPSSPAMANLICFNLDRRLQGLADDLGCRYTRYADDLTFSGSGRRPSSRFLRLVRTIIIDEGLRPNDAKQRIRTRGGRQLVTGIVVNRGLNLPQAEYDRLRAVLHDAGLHGPIVANRGGHPDFRAHLEGRVGWAERLNPVRGARLRDQLESIDWS